MSLGTKASEINNNEKDPKITYTTYKDESQLAQIRRIIDKDLSEPYTVYVYRYFLHSWPQYCHLAVVHELESHGDKIVGAVVCKIESLELKKRTRGYIAMLAVDNDYRNRSIGSTLVANCVRSMICNENCDEVVLETEVTNTAALKLYEKLGFIRYKKRSKYYLNGIDAFRLILCVERTQL